MNSNGTACFENGLRPEEPRPSPGWSLPLPGALPATVLLGVLLLVSRHNFLLFHVAVELCTIGMAIAIFTVAWNTRHLVDNDAFFVLGLGFLGIGLITLLHTLTYKGMALFTDTGGANMATQLWIAARFLEAIAFLAFPLSLQRRYPPAFHAVLWGVLPVLLVLSIVGWPLFPDSFIEGTGLTFFKTASESLFCLAGLAALILLHRRRSSLDRTVYLLFSLAIGLSIFGELFFAEYNDVIGLEIIAGHYLHLAAVFLIYQALVRSSLRRPLDTLFRSLGKQQRLYASILHNAMDGLLIMDRQGRLLEVNAACCRMTGSSRQELLARPILGPDAPLLSADLSERLGLVADGGEDHFETELRQKNGTILKVEASLRYLPIEDGLVIVFFKDITQRKQDELALRQHEEDLKAVFNVTTESIHLIDPDGTVFLANNATAMRLATTMEELLGRRIYDFFPAEVSIARKQVIQQVLDSGEPQTLMDQRSDRTFETHLWPIFNDLGKLHRIAIFSKEVTERIQAERALKHSQALLNATQRLAKAGGWEWQVADQTMTWTEETYRIHGLTPENRPAHSAELVNLSLSCYRSEDRPTILAAFRGCIEDGTPYDLSVPFQRTDGRQLWIRTMAEPVYEDGRIVLVRGNIMDITREKRLERLLAARLRLSETSSSLSLDDLLASVLDEAEQLTGSCIGFFHFVNPDQQTLTLQAWSQSTITHFCEAEGKGMHYPVAEAGVWVDCIHQRGAVIHNDYASLPHRKGLPPGHPPIIRQMVVPVFREEKTVAIFGVGNKVQHYDQDDIEMVTALGDLVWDIILRRRAEEEVRLSEERFRTLLAGLPAVAIQGYRPDGTVHYWNQASEQLYGYTTEEAIGGNLLDLIIPPEIRPEVRQTIASMAKNGRPIAPSELSLMRKDGARVPVFSSHVVLSIEDGAPELFCIDIDLTASKQAAEQLRQSEERFRLSFERSPVGAVMAGQDYRLFRANEVFCRMIGYSEEELSLLTFADITHPDERQRDLLQVRRMLTGDIDRYDVEKRYIHKNGDVIWARVSVTLVRDGDNTPLYFLSIIQDITAWKKAEQALRESESRYQRLADTAREGIWMMNEQHHTTYVNEHMAAMLGLNPADMVGHPVEDYMFAEDLAAHEERMAVRRQGQGGHYEHRFRHRDGHAVWTIASATPLKDDEGRYAGSFAMFTNITGRKEAEAQLRERNAYLQSVFRSSPVGIGVVFDRVLREVNTRLCEITGYSTEELVGRSARLLYPSEAEYHWVGEEKYAQISRNGTGTVETRWQRKDGQIIDVLLSSTPIDSDDLSLGVTFSALDITDRKRAEWQLQQQADFTRRVLDSAAAQIAILDDHGIIIDVNTPWNRFAIENNGLDRTKLGPGASYFCHWSPEHGDTTNAESAFEGIRQVQRGEREFFQVEYPCHSPQENRWFIMRVLPLTGAPGQVLVSHSDITPLKQTEEHLIAALAEKDVLLREVHHRVKNNLAAIISLLDMQSRLLEDAKGRHTLAELGGRIRSMSLIHEKLYRAENLARIDFQGYLQTLLSHLRTSFGAAHIHIQVDARGVQLPLDLAVPCGMIVNELATNAMKHAFPKGQPSPGQEECRLLVSMRQEDGVCTLCVADNGVGLPPDYDWTNAATLGMVLIRMLGRHQLGGSYALDRQEGCSLTLTFNEQRGKI